MRRKEKEDVRKKRRNERERDKCCMREVEKVREWKDKRDIANCV